MCCDQHPLTVKTTTDQRIDRRREPTICKWLAKVNPRALCDEVESHVLLQSRRRES
jgi:hypothetical protein